ncbi:MAG TPA: multidrug ABC transporter ATP-binding protein, partial [Firmicutes bacterium]|nr:multidrug ABC transporter ATP-binding protein [Bacillota bacterium]
GPGTTVVVSTDYMDEAEKCGRVAMMSSGKILQVRTPLELRQPLAGKIYEVRSDRLLEVMDLLRGSVKDVQPFGDRLHVQLKKVLALNPAEGQNWLATILQENGFSGTVTMVEPSLEDVFVDLLAG